MGSRKQARGVVEEQGVRLDFRLVTCCGRAHAWLVVTVLAVAMEEPTVVFLLAKGGEEQLQRDLLAMGVA